MTTETRIDMQATAQARAAIALRFTLESGAWSIPLHRLHHLAGYATLEGEADDYFLGWLNMRGERVPVFDLNRMVCDRPTPLHLGSRIMVLKAAAGAATTFIGLLAAGITDTVSAGDEPVEQLDLDGYLPMLYSLIPAVPEAAAPRI